jgi:hypothetical protein
MSKKIDIKRTLGKQTAPLSIEDVEEMTRLIHNKNTEPILTVAAENPKVNVVAAPDLTEVATGVTANYEKTTDKVVEKTLEKAVELQPAPTKRGRKPKMLMETERLLRVSVDLPESLFIQLKIAVIQQQTDMKTYIRELVAKDLAV